MKKVTQNLFALLLLMVAMQATAQNKATQAPSPYSAVAYYVVAHQDDWQLFMGAHAYNDIASGAKIVMIYITAGDEANTKTGFITKEIGAGASVEYMVANSPLLSGVKSTNTVTTPNINGHALYRHEHKNAISYFLRLKNSDFQKMGADQSLSGNTIDGTSKYTNWCDLTRTIADILTTERVNEGNGWINTIDFDSETNPNEDQTDRLAALAALHATNYHLGACHPMALFVGLDAKNRAKNLWNKDVTNKAGLIQAYHNLLKTSGVPAQQWSNKNYYREVSACKVALAQQGCTEPAVIDRGENAISVRIHPNPASDVLFITPQLNMGTISRVTLTDNLGRLVLEQNFAQENTVKINVSHLAQGAYFLTINAQGGTVTEKVSVGKL